MRKTSLFVIYFIDYQLFIPNITRSVAFAEAHTLQRDAGHYKAKGLPRELVIASVGVLAGHLKGASFQTLLINKKTVGVPPEELD